MNAGLVIKRRAWRAILSALALWPLLHFTLVKQYAINPWKFFGLAMYCRPRLHESATLYEVHGRWRRRVLDPPPTLELELELEQYMNARHAYGELASIAHVQEQASEAGAGDAMILAIDTWSIDSDSNTMVRRRTTQRLKASNAARP